MCSMSLPRKIFRFDRTIFIIMVAVAMLALLFGCDENTENTTTYASDKDKETAFAKADSKPINPTGNIRNLSQQWKDYWYSGEAEITSFSLQQARYGEIREGNAVLIYVTEDFLPEKQVKADRQNDKNIPVLKLNATKNFVTGIYPYSIMTSTFSPVKYDDHAIKIAQSMQEWCGITSMQLNNRNSYEVQVHSYFENRADKTFTLPKVTLENELWNQIRFNPADLPIGDFEIIPDFSFSAMKHVDLKPYKVTAVVLDDRYTITYLEINRELTIFFTKEFPHTITGWEESYDDGGKLMITKATKLKTVRTPYWEKNSNSDTTLRNELQLD